MDARRLELYELLKPKLDEAPARALVLALASDPDNLATRSDVLTVKTDLLALENRLTDRFDARFARMEATLTRRMVTIMGAWTLLFGSTVGWVLAFVR